MGAGRGGKNLSTSTPEISKTLKEMHLTYSGMLLTWPRPHLSRSSGTLGVTGHA